MAVIDRLADDDAILTSDSGTIATWAARHFTIRAGREFYLSGQPRHDGARPARTRSPTSWPTRAASASPSSATAASPC